MLKIALLSAAVGGDNSGDAIIESAVRRLIHAKEFVRLPLTSPLIDADLDLVNGCDALVICGTNLYQQVFACNLSEEVVDRINVPIIPFGVGASAPIGGVPRMNAAGVAAVRAIHRKCRLSSVRDRASLRFLHSIGVSNTTLTGCPVLFHGLACPDFSPTGEGFTVTPRARLLHIDREWEMRQRETLDLLCQRYRPTIVVQSPYDLSLTEDLATRYGLEILQDTHWQAEPYVLRAQSQEMTFGFRLHYAMLSIAYGKPAYLVAHDSRVAEFCALLGLPLFDIRSYSDNLLTLQIESRSFPAAQVQRRWQELSSEMLQFMGANGLPTRLAAEDKATAVAASRRRSLMQGGGKPKIQLLADRRNWAFDHSARAIAKHLRKDFSFDLKYVAEQPKLNPAEADLLHVFFWGEEFHRRFGFAPERVVKEVSSHRWEDDPRYGPCTVPEMAARYLDDCDGVICTSLRLAEMLRRQGLRTYHTPNGYDPQRFRLLRERHGLMKVGWAGNAADPVKGLRDILEPACRDRYPLLVAAGDLPHRRMNDFYNEIDLFVVSSRHEGEPLTLIEAMAAGCFPVCTDVGIAPELITHGRNGFIVRERTVEAFIEAFDWCSSRLSEIRLAGRENARFMARERSWQVCALYFKHAYQSQHEMAIRPRFRNDDVSWDTDLAQFSRFCAIFSRYGMTQVHGVVLHGNTNAYYRFGDVPAEYPGTDTLANLDNQTIRQLSAGKEFAERSDLIDFLRTSGDEIALHGLYHVDYSVMTRAEQKAELTEGVDRLRQLFPGHRIRYFIPPFNRFNADTCDLCHELGLTLLGTEGVHLEAELDTLSLESGRWYRYHHHRFYPQSAFSYYRLSPEQLEKMLQRNISLQPHDRGLLPSNADAWPRILSGVLAGVRCRWR